MGDCPRKGVVYLTTMTYPNPHAHSVQITRTVTALATLVPVVLIVRELACHPEALTDSIRSLYGCEVSENLRVVPFGRYLFKTPGFPLLLRRVRSLLDGSDWVFYTRSYKLASRLMVYRRLHGKRIFFESHKKDAVRKEDPVPGSRYAALREARERDNESPALIRKIYQGADTVFFLHRHSEVLARARFALGDTQFLWYGLKDLAYPPLDARPENFVYIGSLAASRLFELLMDAAAMAPEGFRVDVFGGSDADIAARKAQLARVGLEHKFDFRGYVPNHALKDHLQRYRFGISLIEGMKVVDYVENGVVPVIPRIPSFLDVFDESTAVLFEPDCAASLRAALEACLGGRHDNAALTHIARDYSIAHRAQLIVEHL